MTGSNIITNRRKFGATMMVTGCCIGAGMIGLPVVSALTGFVPSVVAMAFVYLFTTVTGLLLVEATLWFDGHVNLPSIVEHSLGRLGKIITIILFSFLFYCLFVAFLDGGGAIFAEILSNVLRRPVPHYVGIFTCLIYVVAVAYSGAKATDYSNRFMFAGLVVSYFTLVVVGMPHVDTESLYFTNWSAIFGVVPILLLCFGYQNLVPTLVYYLQKDARAIRFAIVVGNFIPFLVYFLWDYIILGLLPINQVGVEDNTQMVTGLLAAAAIPSISVIFFIKSFSLFAILTSFLPSAVSFVDFLKDGLSKLLHQRVSNDVPIYLLVFLPPTICALVYPQLFLQALGFAGGFIDVLLFGVLPALVVLAGRRMVAANTRYQVIGGAMTPIFIIIICMFLLYLKISEFL